MFEFEVIVEDSDYGLGEFKPAEAGTAKIPKGKNGYYCIIVRIWVKDDKETLIKIRKDITIKPNEYENSSIKGNGGSGGGSSSGGSSSSSTRNDTNNFNSNNIIITKIILLWEFGNKWMVNGN